MLHAMSAKRTILHTLRDKLYVQAKASVSHTLWDSTYLISKNQGKAPETMASFTALVRRIPPPEKPLEAPEKLPEAPVDLSDIKQWLWNGTGDVPSAEDLKLELPGNGAGAPFVVCFPVERGRFQDSMCLLSVCGMHNNGDRYLLLYLSGTKGAAAPLCVGLPHPVIAIP